MLVYAACFTLGIIVGVVFLSLFVDFSDEDDNDEDFYV